MKKKNILFLSLFLSCFAYGAIVRIQNNTKNPLEAGIKYGKISQPGEKRKAEVIEPGKSALFNSWIEEIHTIYWKEGNEKWKIAVDVPAFNIERKYIIYENGHYDSSKNGEKLKAKPIRKKERKAPEPSEVQKNNSKPKKTKPTPSAEPTSRTKKKLKKEETVKNKPKKVSPSYEEHMKSKTTKIALGENSPEWNDALHEELERRSGRSHNSDTYNIDQDIKEKRRRLEEVEEMEAENTAAEMGMEQ